MFMKILVCIKQIANSKKINKFDVYALEEALAIKEQFCSKTSNLISVDVVTVGLQNASQIIKRAFGMGVNRGYHIIVAENSEYVSSFVTASKLAAIARITKYDLILTGIMSEDMMDGQTGPMLARIMKFPCATGVVKIALPDANSSNIIEVEREIENGFRDCIKIKLPAVLTIQAGINTPRYPGLSNMLAANKKNIISFTEADLFPGTISEKQLCTGIEYPEKTRTGLMLNGSLSDKVAQLTNFLKEKSFI